MAGKRKQLIVDEAFLYLEYLEISFLDDEEIESDEDRDVASRGELVILPPGRFGR